MVFNGALISVVGDTVYVGHWDTSADWSYQVLELLLDTCAFASRPEPQDSFMGDVVLSHHGVWYIAAW